MPSLGFLKKKKTKEIPSPVTKFPGNQSGGGDTNKASGPAPAVDGGAVDRVLTKNSAYNREPDSIAGTDSIAPTTTSEPPPPTSGGGEMNQPSIQNMLNQQPSSQHDSAYSSSHGSAQQGLAGDGKAGGNQIRETKGKYTLTDFNIQRTLGTGSFGRVHLVQSKHNQRFYAVKVLKKAQVVKMKQVEHTNDERLMLQRCRHPFLITLWGTWQDSKNLYMVMDFIEGGELFSLLRKSQVSSSLSLRSSTRR